MMTDNINPIGKKPHFFTAILSILRELPIDTNYIGDSMDVITCAKRIEAIMEENLLSLRGALNTYINMSDEMYSWTDVAVRCRAIASKALSPQSADLQDPIKNNPASLD